MEAIKLAFEATVITMIFIGILALLINLIPSKKFCVVCGDPSIDDFCCEGCENLRYDEEELNREEEIEDGEIYDEDEEWERWEKIGKALP
ncbi:MAG: hypothetical protein E3J87_09020 [Candidatus Cloacimonadota bacterium]|nr:MAG: hypothetical protein E3J87_09020 [Candidatus Cloacimonadota bacterium]